MNVRIMTTTVSPRFREWTDDRNIFQYLALICETQRRSRTLVEMDLRTIRIPLSSRPKEVAHPAACFHREVEDSQRKDHAAMIRLCVGIPVFSLPLQYTKPRFHTQ